MIITIIKGRTQKQIELTTTELEELMRLTKYGRDLKTFVKHILDVETAKVSIEK